MKDRVFLISFAKCAALFTYIMFHFFLVAMTSLMITEPPAWLLLLTSSPGSVATLTFLLGLTFIHFLYIPIAVSLANHDVLEMQRRQVAHLVRKRLEDNSEPRLQMNYSNQFDSDLR